MECGARLRPPTSDLALAPPAIESEESDRLPVLSTPASHPMFDPTTGHLLAIPPPPPLPPPDEDATNVLPAVGAPLGRGGFGPPDVSAQGPGRWDHPSDSGPLWPSEALGYADEAAPATTMQPPYRTEYDGAGYYDATGRVPATYVPWEGPVAAPWEAAEAPTAPPAFRVKPLLIIAILAAAAAIVGMVARILDVDGTGAGPRRGVEAQRLRYQPHRRRHRHRPDDDPRGASPGAPGSAGVPASPEVPARPSPGGSPLPSVRLSSSLRQAEPAGASVAVTRDVGYWALVAAGGIGLIALFVSLLRTGDDGRAGLDPWVAALGAMATIAAVIGPLLPVDDADIQLNWSSAPGTDVPTLWFVARFVQLGLLLLCGVFGFLLVRRYGLGLAIGGTICAGWLVLTAATEQTARPIGLAIGNPDFTDLEPHIVTIVGVGLMLFFGLVATAMALIDDR